MAILVNVAGTYLNPANIAYLVDASSGPHEQATMIYFVGQTQTMRVELSPDAVAGIVNQ